MNRTDFLIALIGLSVSTGYSEMERENLRQANPDAIFCTIVFVTMILFSLGSVWYSISDAKQTTLRRPFLASILDRLVHDPLQCLFGVLLRHRCHGCRGGISTERH